jgi:hypothetical protein
MKNRIAGVLWLIVIIAGGWSFMVASAMVVHSDAAATAANILASESSYRLAFVASLIAGACYMGVTVILYDLLKPVNRTLSMLAASFGVAGVAVGGASAISHFAPLVVLASSPYGAAFTPGQLQALAYMALRLQTVLTSAAMVFFGIQCFSAGYLIVRSTFIPRILGVLLAIGGLSYVTASFATFLAPQFGARLALYILPTGLLGEGSLCVWLIVTGASRATAHDAALRSASSPEPRATPA